MGRGKEGDCKDPTASQPITGRHPSSQVSHISNGSVKCHTELSNKRTCEIRSATVTVTVTHADCLPAHGLPRSRLHFAWRRRCLTSTVSMDGDDDIYIFSCCSSNVKRRKLRPNVTPLAKFRVMNRVESPPGLSQNGLVSIQSVY